MKKSTELILLVIVLAVLILLRIVPTYISNSLFSADIWPLYRSSQRLIDNPEARIWNEKFFDRYNNYWPGVILSTVVYTLILGISLEDAYGYSYTIIYAFTILILFYIILRLFFDKAISIIALTFFGLVPSLLIFTSSPLKEVYAYTMFYSILLIAIKKLVENNSSLRDYLLVIILGTGLVITHHLATFMLIGFLLSIPIILTICHIKCASVSSHYSLLWLLLFTITISIIGLIYYNIYSYKGLRITITMDTIIIYLIYATLLYGSYSILTGSRCSIPKPLILSILITIAIISLFISRGSLSGISPSLAMVYWYIIPLASSLILIVLHIDDILIRSMVFGFGIFILLNILYIVFVNPIFTSILHRFLNYITIPLSILIGYSFRDRGLLIKLYVLAIIFLTVLSSLLVLYNVVNSGFDVSYFWYYPQCECMGYDFIISHMDNTTTLIGDDKVRGYYTMIHTVFQQPYLEAEYLGIQKGSNWLFIVYIANYKIGLSIGLNIYRLPNEIIYNLYSRVFDNGCIQGFR